MRESMNKLTNTRRSNVVHKQCVSYIYRQKRGIVLLIWEYRGTNYVQESANPNTYITYAVSFGGVAPKPRVKLPIFTFKADIFLIGIRKP